MEPIQHDTLQSIWNANGLGQIHTVQRAKRGSNNLATVVNDRYVIRFDLLDLDGTCRYKGEQLAYRLLREADIPAPEVVALDLSKSIIPYNYIILSKIDGTPLIDDWASFSQEQRAATGRAAGRYLAMMHNIMLDGFGNLSGLEGDPLPRWYDHVDGFFERYAAALLNARVIDPAIYARMRRCVDHVRPLVDMSAHGRLIHSDYQFENVLHCDGVITGIIDFEWAISGDPTWDFRVDEQWDDDSPGSARYIYEGYTSLRPLAEDHELRRWLYKVLFHLDSVDMYAGDTDEQDDFTYFYGEMMKALARLERLLGFL